MRRFPCRRRRCRGIFLLDAIIALAIISVLATILAVSVSRVGQAERRMADQRAAARAAEAVASRLTAKPDTAPPESLDGAAIRVEPATQVDASVRTFKVIAMLNGARAEVVGFTPVKVEATR